MIDDRFAPEMMIDDRFASEPLHQMPQRWEKLNYPTNGLLNQQRGDLQRESLGNLKQKTFQSLKQWGAAGEGQKCKFVRDAVTIGAEQLLIWIPICKNSCSCSTSSGFFPVMVCV